MNISRQSKLKIRNTIFRHLDGITIAPTIDALFKKGIIDYMEKEGHWDLCSIIRKFNANIGYINIALRLLASQGWLMRTVLKDGKNIEYSLTDLGRNMIQYAHKYSQLIPWYSEAVYLEKLITENNLHDIDGIFYELLQSAENLWGFTQSDIDDISSVEFQILNQLNGGLIGPVIVALGRAGLLKEPNTLLDYLVCNNYQSISRIFSLESWILKNDDNYVVTPEGEYAISLATAYGVTVSYLSTFLQLSELLYGNPTVLWHRTESGDESHVNRPMNVWGSGGAHKTYFDTIDKIIIETFNQPIEQQPIGIADMGCGDGSFLKHIYEVVTSSTRRGAYIHDYPLVIIGGDFNPAARVATEKTLSDAGIHHHVLHGNIGNPKSFAEKIKSEFNVDLSNLLNVRSFLDHNRIYTSPNQMDSSYKSNSTGAFAFRGKWIPNYELEQNLIDHFNNWKPYIEKHGLLVLELHTIPPELTANNLGRTLATAYDATHGYTDQYIVELDIMLDCARKAGLIEDLKFQKLFPGGELTTVSINLLKC